MKVVVIKKERMAQREGARSAPARGRKLKDVQRSDQIPSHVPTNNNANNHHFTQKHIDMQNLPKSDFTAVLKIAHDLRIGFNRFDMFLDRFERQKRVVQNNNFKLMCGKGPAAEDIKRMETEKKEAITQQIKDKRMMNALFQLKDVGSELENESMGNTFVDNEALESFVERLRASIRLQNQKLNGVPEQSANRNRKTNKKEQKQPQQADNQQSQPDKPEPEAAAKTDLVKNNTVKLADLKKTSILGFDNAKIGEGCKMLSLSSLGSLEETLALKKQQSELEADRKLVEELMDPKNDLDNTTKDEFQAYLERDHVFEGLASQIFINQDEKNKELNERYPLMVKMETSQQQVKHVLKGLDQSTFVALRDLKTTPSQLASRMLQKISGISYQTADDLRELMGNENMNQSRFCGILNRLIIQKATEMGCLTKGYEKFYMEEIITHGHELPEGEKCIKSQLTKDNILKHQSDEALAKRLLKAARLKQVGYHQKSKSQEKNGKKYNQDFYNSTKHHVKTHEEISREKEALLRMQREKAARERQSVLDNIHILRLREMFPDAKIQCSDHIENLISAFSRRNMVDSEVQEELTIAKLQGKKPRPLELMQGNAIVRPRVFEYKSGYHENQRKKDRNSLSPEEFNNASFTEHQSELGRNGESQDRPRTQTLQVYMPHHMSEPKEKTSKSPVPDTNIPGPCKKHAEPGRRRFGDKTISLDPAETQETINLGGTLQPKTINIKEPFNSVVAQHKMEDSQEVLQADSKQDELSRQPVASNDEVMLMIDTVQTDLQKDADLVGIIRKQKSQTQSQSIRQTYLAGGSIVGAVNEDLTPIKQDYNQVESQPSYVEIRNDSAPAPVKKSENVATFATGQKARDSCPTNGQTHSQLQLTPPQEQSQATNERHVIGIFKQQSETCSINDHQQHRISQLNQPATPYSNQNYTMQTSKRQGRKKREECEAKMALELGNMRSKSNRENRFMDKIRNDAANRKQSTRGGGEFYLTLSGLRNGRRVNKHLLSARTIHREQAAIEQSPSPAMTGARPTENISQHNKSMVDQQVVSHHQHQLNHRNHLTNRGVFSNATTNHSFLNSQHGSIQQIQPKNSTMNLEKLTANSSNTDAMMANKSSNVTPHQDSNWIDNKYQARPIKSYRMPLTANTVISQETNRQNQVPITALQKRFPQRELHTAHGLGTTQKSRSGTQGAIITYDRWMTPDTPVMSQVKTVEKQRPVTGGARHTRNSALYHQSNDTKLLKHSLLKHLADNQNYIEKHPYQQICRDGNIWGRNQSAAAADETEFCELPESQLPDGVMAFMERNDLPVFIDNKHHRTIKFKNLHQINGSKAPILLSSHQKQSIRTPECKLLHSKQRQARRNPVNMEVIKVPSRTLALTPMEATLQEHTPQNVNDFALQQQQKHTTLPFQEEQPGETTKRRIVVCQNQNNGKGGTVGEQEDVESKSLQALNIVSEQSSTQINQDLDKDYIDKVHVRNNSQDLRKMQKHSDKNISSMGESQMTKTIQDTSQIPKNLFQKSRDGRRSAKSTKSRRKSGCGSKGSDSHNRPFSSSHHALEKRRSSRGTGSGGNTATPMANKKAFTPSSMVKMDAVHSSSGQQDLILAQNGAQQVSQGI